MRIMSDRPHDDRGLRDAFIHFSGTPSKYPKFDISWRIHLQYLTVHSRDQNTHVAACVNNIIDCDIAAWLLTLELARLIPTFSGRGSLTNYSIRTNDDSFFCMSPLLASTL
mmetsp:Transcript_8374/g.24778  ORF Transcript_8374/g.24778 Transcript_8374/m.24778 type:complete len:111 (+) Transcript_8374:275-607(+)